MYLFPPPFSLPNSRSRSTNLWNLLDHFPLHSLRTPGPHVPSPVAWRSSVAAPPGFDRFVFRGVSFLRVLCCGSWPSPYTMGFFPLFTVAFSFCLLRPSFFFFILFRVLPPPPGTLAVDLCQLKPLSVWCSPHFSQDAPASILAVVISFYRPPSPTSVFQDGWFFFDQDNLAVPL